MHYLVQPGDQIFVKGYRFSSFAKNMGKIELKNWLVKSSQKLLNYVKQSAIDALKS